MTGLIGNHEIIKPIKEFPSLMGLSLSTRSLVLVIFLAQGVPKQYIVVYLEQ